MSVLYGTGLPVVQKISSGVVVNSSMILGCQPQTGAKETVGGFLDDYAPISIDCRLGTMVFDRSNVKAFVGASTTLTLHADFMFGNDSDKVVVADIFEPLDLKAIAAETDPAVGGKPWLIESSGAIYWVPILKGAIASDSDLDIYADLRYFSIREAFIAHLGINSKRVSDQRYIDGAQTYGIFSEHIRSSVTSSTPYSLGIRFRFVSTVALIIKDKGLAFNIDIVKTVS